MWWPIQRPGSEETHIIIANDGFVGKSFTGLGGGQWIVPLAVLRNSIDTNYVSHLARREGQVHPPTFNRTTHHYERRMYQHRRVRGADSGAITYQPRICKRGESAITSTLGTSISPWRHRDSPHDAGVPPRPHYMTFRTETQFVYFASGISLRYLTYAVRNPT